MPVSYRRASPPPSQESQRVLYEVRKHLMATPSPTPSLFSRESFLTRETANLGLTRYSTRASTAELPSPLLGTNLALPATEVVSKPVRGRCPSAALRHGANSRAGSSSRSVFMTDEPSRDSNEARAAFLGKHALLFPDRHVRSSVNLGAELEQMRAFQEDKINGINNLCRVEAQKLARGQTITGPGGRRLRRLSLAPDAPSRCSSGTSTRLSVASAPQEANKTPARPRAQSVPETGAGPKTPPHRVRPRDYDYPPESPHALDTGSEWSDGDLEGSEADLFAETPPPAPLPPPTPPRARLPPPTPPRQISATPPRTISATPPPQISEAMAYARAYTLARLNGEEVGLTREELDFNFGVATTNLALTSGIEAEDIGTNDVWRMVQSEAGSVVSVLSSAVPSAPGPVDPVALTLALARLNGQTGVPREDQDARYSQAIRALTAEHGLERAELARVYGWTIREVLRREPPSQAPSEIGGASSVVSSEAFPPRPSCPLARALSAGSSAASSSLGSDLPARPSCPLGRALSGASSSTSSSSASSSVGSVVYPVRPSCPVHRALSAASSTSASSSSSAPVARSPGDAKPKFAATSAWWTGGVDTATKAPAASPKTIGSRTSSDCDSGVKTTPAPVVEAKEPSLTRSSGLLAIKPASGGNKTPAAPSKVWAKLARWKGKTSKASTASPATAALEAAKDTPALGPACPAEKLAPTAPAGKGAARSALAWAKRAITKVAR